MVLDKMQEIDMPIITKHVDDDILTKSLNLEKKCSNDILKNE